MLSAHKMCENVPKLYYVPKIPRIHQLKVSIASCKQDNLEAVEFFSKLVGLWSELENYIKIAVYKCGLAGKTVKMLEEDKTH